MAIPAKNKIRGVRAFAAIFRTVRPTSSAHLSIRAQRSNPSSAMRYSVTVPVKVAPTAVLRSGARRRVSEAIRRIMQQRTVRPDVAAVFSVKQLPLPSGKTLEHELLILMEKSGILSR
ncbi:MAG: ribonuclease P protein component [Candidatus Yanofskybacteria bacterium]|nr:ribonuclease P protein component [Candidatus Yanofskybacteria bacterium]